MGFLKAFVDPMPITFCVLAVLLYKTRGAAPRWLWRAAVVLLCVLYVGSARMSGNAIVRMVQDACPASMPDAPVDAVLVLGAGFSAPSANGRLDLSPGSMSRLLAGIRAYRSAHARTLILSGGATTSRPDTEAGIMALQAMEAGVPADAIVQEARSFNTWDEARELTAQFASGPRVALVTSAFHMRRARYAFSRTGATVVPVSVGCTERTSFAVYTLIPSAYTLQNSAAAVHEVVGLWWYRLRSYRGR